MKAKYSLLIFWVLLFLPTTLQAKTCRDYKPDLAQALSDCDWEAVKKIETIAIDSNDFCLKGITRDIKCSFFYSCSSKDMDMAFKSCNIDPILAIRNLVENDMTHCATFLGMRDNVMGIKCLYYDRCGKTIVERKIRNCDMEGFLEILDKLTSKLMFDCYNYAQIAQSLHQEKRIYFNNCTKRALVASSRNCDLEYILKIEKIMKTHFKDSTNFKKILAVILEFKCAHLNLCVTPDIENAAQECNIGRIIELENLLNSNLVHKCSYDSEHANNSLYDAKTKYYKNCAANDLKQAYLNEDWTLINLILKSLTTYPNNKIKSKLLREKITIFSETVKMKLKNGMESCDLDAILDAEEFVQHEKDLPNLVQIQEWTNAAKCGYFVRCVEADIDQAQKSCNLNQILKIEKEARKVENIAGCVDKDNSILESKCQYFLDCIQNDLDKSLRSCDENRIEEIDALIKTDIIDDCPNASKLPKPIREAKMTFFSRCTVNSLYKALGECNLNELIAIEKEVASKLQNDPDYKDIFKVVWEIKCSYVDKCMQKELDFLAHNCDQERIEEIENTVNHNMGNCYNYGIFETNISTLKKTCSQ